VEKFGLTVNLIVGIRGKPSAESATVSAAKLRINFASTERVICLDQTQQEENVEGEH